MATAFLLLTTAFPLLTTAAISRSVSGVASFAVPGRTAPPAVRNRRRPIAPTTTTPRDDPFGARRAKTSDVALANDENDDAARQRHTWTPRDLTEDVPGYPPIPDDDYVKKYQRNPELWPVEFFLIAYRRRAKDRDTGSVETQVLVRKSANGTSKWGLGTGVPATRWSLSSAAQTPPPAGYEWSEPAITFDARNFPEFPEDHEGQSWTYGKVDIREDAFASSVFEDPELEEYAERVREGLRAELSDRTTTMNDNDDDIDVDVDGGGATKKKNPIYPWQSGAISAVRNVLDGDNCRAAIQGTLRTSGLFARRRTEERRPRRASLDGDAPDPAELARSARIFTMFPQMPDPMPLPSTSSEELRKEIANRDFHMKRVGRDPHRDKYGRMFTHKSTSNVSNTIHGVYLTLDATDLPGLDEVPALDLFGTEEIRREWMSLVDLKVLDSDGKSIGTEDTKPTFISGFIVRQLVKEGVIAICQE